LLLRNLKFDAKGNLKYSLSERRTWI
jgi:hypothetical protein